MKMNFKNFLTTGLLLVLGACSSINSIRQPASEDGSCLVAVNSFFHQKDFTTANILKNVVLNESERVDQAEVVLGRSLNLNSRLAVIKAHKVGKNQLGADGLTQAGVKLDGTTNYTQAQIRRKYVILKEAGFTPLEIKKLLDSGITGENRLSGLTDNQIKKLEAQEIAFVNKGLPNLQKYNLVIPQDNPDIKYNKFYQAIADFLDEPRIAFERVKDLEIEILRRGNERPGVDGIVLLNEVLGEMEAKHGFNPVIELEDKSYSNEEFWAMLRGGALFNDIVFGKGGVGGSRSGHGEYTHRIQWYAIMREVELNPDRFKDGNNPLPRVADVFKHTGDEKLTAISNNGKDLWFRLVDAGSEAKSLHRPERFHSIHEYWEGILWK